MELAILDTAGDAHSYEVSPERLHSATHEEILAGLTTDIYFLKTRDVLRAAGRLDAPVVADIFTRKGGVFAGSQEVLQLFKSIKADVTVEALAEGDTFEPKEVVMRIRGPYGAFGLYETVILGMLASSTGFATAARECVAAANGLPVFSFGARHVHPAVASVMERAAVIGGCGSASCILGAKILGRQPKGTVPHAAALIMGDTVELAKVYDAQMPPEEPRAVLVDTFKDECEEALRVAHLLKEKLASVRLDTPGERGGVTPDLVKEVRYRLCEAGYGHVGVFVSGGLTPERIAILALAGACGFGVGSYISHPDARDMTMDLKEIDGKAIAKRGRLPGPAVNKRLQRVY